MTRKAGIELEARWKIILEDFVASGCRVNRYCQEYKISKASLYKWSKRLNIPIRKQSSLTKTHQIDKNDTQSSFIEEKEAFSFIELKAPPFNASTSFPVKLELLLAQGRLLKIETSSSWDEVVGMIKELVS